MAIAALTIMISIHAPTRGATVTQYELTEYDAISIHAPTRGATHTEVLRMIDINFNPRSHERSDDYRIGRYAWVFISIHAPTRGATCWSGRYLQDKEISIHAPTRGATFTTSLDALHLFISIHAPTRGATYDLGATIAGSLFQSTLPREERLNCFADIVTASGISIHAPTRGATKHLAI